MDELPKTVTLDWDTYQELLARLDRAEAIVGIHRGLVSMRRGEGRPAEEVFAGIRARFKLGRSVD